MARQFSWALVTASPTICCSAKTSQSRNSTRSLPSDWVSTMPLTSAWALITRQSAKRGMVRSESGVWMKAFLSIGLNRPGALEIGRDHAGDIGARLRVIGLLAVEIGDGDRHRLHRRLGDVDAKLGPRGGGGKSDTERKAARAAGRRFNRNMA